MTNEDSNTIAYASYGLWSLGTGGTGGYIVVQEVAVEVESSTTDVEIERQTIYIEVSLIQNIEVEIDL